MTTRGQRDERYEEGLRRKDAREETEKGMVGEVFPRVVGGLEDVLGEEAAKRQEDLASQEEPRGDVVLGSEREREREEAGEKEEEKWRGVEGKATDTD